MKKTYLLFFLLFALYTISKAQDTTNILKLSVFYEQIQQNHPIVQQANLMNNIAQQEIRMARGYFDPKLELDYDRKEFDKKDYFNIWNSYVKVPLWIGEIKVAYEQNNGVFLNEERTVPNEGLLSAGITVPLGQGLLINQRRATLKQAQIFQNTAKIERLKMINKVLFAAAKDYWNWYFAYEQYRLQQAGYNLAKQRFEGIKQNVALGELAAIDSVKAKTIFQTRAVELRQAEVELQNARLLVSNHLWNEDKQPLELLSNVVPQDFDPNSPEEKIDDIGNLLSFAEDNHPEIQKLLFKLQDLDIEKRLQADRFKPKIDLSYNFLSQAQNSSDKTEFSSNFFQENYKVGLKFSFPILLRKERGKLAQVRIKENQTQFELSQKKREILNKIQAAYNELTNLQEQMIIQADMVVNYRIQRDGELQKFISGESDLFFVNIVDNLLIESEIKLAKQKTNYEKARAKLIWTSGQMDWR